MPRLDFYTDFKLFVKLNLQEQDVILGRAPDCPVQLPDKRISRHHAVIRHRKDGYWLEDQSTHGTRLNASMIGVPTMLRPGDRIYIGPYIIIFQPDTAPAEDLAAEVTAQ
jgi:pSer/pThr/pTyr-binding forkhead associated (FHA) protein